MHSRGVQHQIHIPYAASRSVCSVSMHDSILHSNRQKNPGAVPHRLHRLRLLARSLHRSEQQPKTHASTDRLHAGTGRASSKCASGHAKNHIALQSQHYRTKLPEGRGAHSVAAARRSCNSSAAAAHERCECVLNNSQTNFNKHTSTSRITHAATVLPAARAARGSLFSEAMDRPAKLIHRWCNRPTPT